MPLASWEVLSISVLLKGLLITRLLRLHARLGPLMLMVLKMVYDLVLWVIIVGVPVVSFAASLYTLYKDEFISGDAAKDDACIDPDQEFQTFGSGLLILLDTMLFADPLYACYRESSSPVIGTVLIYLYVLITAIMLVNMLIALMAKTFDNVFEAQETHYLFLKARTISDWLQYPAAPPPLNLLSLPYLLVYTSRAMLHRLQRWLKGRPRARDATRRTNALLNQPDYAIPPEWMAENLGERPQEVLSASIAEFMMDHGDEVSARGGGWRGGVEDGGEGERG